MAERRGARNWRASRIATFLVRGPLRNFISLKIISTVFSHEEAGWRVGSRFSAARPQLSDLSLRGQNNQTGGHLFGGSERGVSLQET